MQKFCYAFMFLKKVQNLPRRDHKGIHKTKVTLVNPVNVTEGASYAQTYGRVEGRVDKLMTGDGSNC